MVVLLPFAYLAGVVTVMSPCILPILPIILASAFGNSRWRPLGVVLGLVVSFSFFTLALTAIVSAFGVSADALRLGGALIIGLFGLVLLVPALNRHFEGLTSRLASFGGFAPVGGGFGSGFLVGASLGLVWAPCAGPILASVTTLVATSRISPEAVAVTLAYSGGVGTPMLLIAYGGRRIVNHASALNRHTVSLQRAFGALMVVFALTLFAGVDRVVQTALVEAVPPEWSNVLTSFERNQAVRESLDRLRGREPSAIAGGETTTAPMVANSEPTPTQVPVPRADLPDLGPAPELRGIVGWINGEPTTLAALRGKVVLVDFWTYSCINCIRTLPYLVDWHKKYADDGLVILGVHTPEFEFEKSRDNVARAVQQHGIEYLVAQDNAYATWRAFDNLYWPAKYLIDADGRIRYTHFGEGEYDKTEANIVALLAEAGRKASLEGGRPQDYTLAGGRTPELYLGAARQQALISPERFAVDKSQHFSAPANLPRHRFALSGEWTISREHASPAPGARLDLRFVADDVFLVLVPSVQGEEVTVLLDGQAISAEAAGADVREGRVQVGEPRLYHLVDLRGTPGEHTLSLVFHGGHTDAFAFTFG